MGIDVGLRLDMESDSGAMSENELVFICGSGQDHLLSCHDVQPSAFSSFFSQHVSNVSIALLGLFSNVFIASSDGKLQRHCRNLAVLLAAVPLLGFMSEYLLDSSK